jgi:hypothetical protein
VKANVVRLATIVVGLISVVVAFVDRLPTDIPATIMRFHHSNSADQGALQLVGQAALLFDACLQLPAWLDWKAGSKEVPPK